MRTQIILTADCVAGRAGEEKSIRTSELSKIEGCYKEVTESTNKAILSPKSTKKVK